MVTRVLPLQVGEKVAERNGVNVPESRGTEGEAEFWESQVMKAVKTRSWTTILAQVRGPHLVQY